MRHSFVSALLALGLLVHSAPALAYIDPGTGSALFYVVTGIVLSAYFALRSLYYRAIDLLFSLRRLDQKCDLAIHCEDPRYESTFMPIIRQLAGRGIPVTLFTMYPRDGSYEPLPDGVVHKAIPAGMMGYAYLNNIEAVVLATTTPQLDVMTFRRSRRVRHYVMVQHALGESRYVRPYAYDYFDSVLCCGPVLKENIRKMEAIRETPAKRLYETGLPHYEVLRASAQCLPAPSGAPVVLVAPSWGPLSMFEAFGVDFVAAIAQRYRVIVRPHPQMKVSQTELYERILALEGVEVDTGRTPEQAMAKAHILLSDISGIAHEFAFIHERPVLIVDQKERLGGLEGEVLGGGSELRRLCADFIVPMPPSEMPEILIHLERTLAGHSATRLVEVRGQVVYNFDTASEIAANQLEEIYQCEKRMAEEGETVRVGAQVAK
ncbi:MAG: CDP-glycerol glycerophosphotransferase family protein [Moraxellaceae bacterium]|nr:CDP-glycerol glycerophosphotransferase family protein [Moraxellaceae bacterium]